MPLVLKGNKQLTVVEEKVDEFLAMGYSEIDEEGKVIQKGKASDLKDIKAEYDTICLQLDKVVKENEKIKKDNDKLSKENEKLSKENEQLKAAQPQ